MPDWTTTLRETFLHLADDRQDYWQWAAIALCLLGAAALSVILRKSLFCEDSRCQQIFRRFFKPGKNISPVPAVFCILLWITWAARSQWSVQLVRKGHEALPCGYIYSAALLVTAFVVYRITDAVSNGRLAPRFLGGGMLLIFALHLFGWLTPLSTALQNVSLPIGDVDINLWAIIWAIAALFTMLWLVGLSTRFIDAAVRTRNDIPPSIKVLVGKATRLCLYTAAILGALKIGGVPLGGLAVFSGALGLGLGFGLQKIISNLVSGVIILLDKSIKPGDVIEIEGTYGWINSIRTASRQTSASPTPQTSNKPSASAKK